MRDLEHDCSSHGSQIILGVRLREQASARFNLLFAGHSWHPKVLRNILRLAPFDQSRYRERVHDHRFRGYTEIQDMYTLQAGQRIRPVSELGNVPTNLFCMSTF